MAFVVTQPCHGCKYTDCVTVCPVEAFVQDADMLYIDPETCIDCGMCVPECPVEAIFAEADVPNEWQHFIQLNADRARSGTTPITERQEPKMGPTCGKR